VNAIEVLDTHKEERYLLRRRVIYRLSDRGRRALEICEGLSDEEAKDLLGISSRQLDMLRRLKDGSKRAVDFPYYVRRNLKRLIERGFLVRTVEGVDAEEIKRMRDEGLTNREIARKLGISLTALQYWINKLNLEKRSKGLNWIRHRNRLIRLLKKNGPMPRSEVIETLGLRYDQIEKILRMFPEIFQKLNFTVGRKKYHRRFHSLFKASPVLMLRDDPRIVEFVASKINMKVQTRYEAKSVIHLLKYQIGTLQARAVVEKLGYQYKNIHKANRTI